MTRKDIYNFKQLEGFIPTQLDGLKNGYIHQFGFTTNELRTIRIRLETRSRYDSTKVFAVYYRGRLFGIYLLSEYARVKKDIEYLLCKYGWENTHTIVNGGER